MEGTTYEISPVPIEAIARVIKERGLTVPAIFFLEMQKPLANVTASALAVTEPFLQMLLGRKFVRYASQIVSSRETMESLILRLEELG